MPQRWRKILLSLLAVPALFTACKKQYSSDAPLTPSYTPSIIINSDEQVLYGINPTNGVKNWQCTISGLPGMPSFDFQSSPLLYNERVYIMGTYAGSSTDTIYKINSETGAIVSKVYFLIAGSGHGNMQATPIATRNLLFIPMGDTLYALDTGTLKIQWKYSPGTGGSMESSPSIYNDTLYGATTDGIVYAIATTQTPATTGAAVTAEWTYQATSASSGTGPFFISSPAINAPYLYIGSVNDSNMYCIYLQPTTAGSPTGNLRWTYKTHGPVYSSPTAQDGVCIFGCDDFSVYCLDTFINPLHGVVSPTARWIQPTSSTVRSSPTLVNNVVYIGSYDYNLYALNVVNGDVKWRFKTTALIKSSPIVYGGYVYVGSYDKNLYALDTSLGTQRWMYNTNGQIECSPVVDDLSGMNQYNSQISGFTN